MSVSYTHLDVYKRQVFAQMLSEPTARLLIPLCVVSPFVIILLCGGTKALKGVVGITLVSALSFVIPFYLVATFVGPELCVVIGSLVCLVCTIVMGRKHTNIPEEYMLESKEEAAASSDKPQMSMVKACLLYTSSPDDKKLLEMIFTDEFMQAETNFEAFRDFQSSSAVFTNWKSDIMVYNCLLYTSRCV